MITPWILKRDRSIMLPLFTKGNRKKDGIFKFVVGVQRCHFCVGIVMFTKARCVE